MTKWCLSQAYLRNLARSLWKLEENSSFSLPWWQRHQTTFLSRACLPRSSGHESLVRYYVHVLRRPRSENVMGYSGARGASAFSCKMFRLYLEVWKISELLASEIPPRRSNWKRTKPSSSIWCEVRTRRNFVEGKLHLGFYWWVPEIKTLECCTWRYSTQAKIHGEPKSEIMLTKEFHKPTFLS